MNKTLHFHRYFINFGILIFLFGTLLIHMKSSALQGNDSLNLAITVYLLFTVPLVYFLLIRKSDIPNTTVIPVILIGLVLGSYFLPKDSQSYLTIFKTWILPIIELSILTFTIIKVRKAISTYKKMNGLSPDFYIALKSTCYEILPKRLVFHFATEITVFYYRFIQKERTSHKRIHLS